MVTRWTFLETRAIPFGATFALTCSVNLVHCNKQIKMIFIVKMVVRRQNDYVLSSKIIYQSLIALQSRTDM